MLRDSVITIASKVLVTIIGLASSVIIARMLGPTWRGYLALIMIPQAIFLRVAPMGIDRGNIFYCAKEPEHLRDIMRNSFWSGLAIGIVSFIIFWLYTYTGHFVEFSGRVNMGFYLIVAATFPFLLLSQYFDALIYGSNRLTIRNLKEVFVKGALLIFVLIGFYVFNKRLLAPVGATFAMALVGCATSFYLVNKYVGRIDIRGFNWPYFREKFSFGFKNHVSVAAVGLITTVIILIARGRIPYEFQYRQMNQIAFLSIALMIFENGMILPRSIVFALLPKITGLSSNDAMRSTLKAGRYNILLTPLVFIPLGLVIQRLVVFLYGPAYEQTASAFGPLVFGAIFLSLGEVWATGLFARGKANVILLAGILALVASVITGYFWLYKYNIFGGACAVSFGFLVYAVVLLIAFAIEYPFRGRDAFVLNSDDIAELKTKFNHRKL